MRAIVYCRVSTDAQERDGTSLDTQERACLEHGQANGWQVLECIRDTASGFTLDRPGIERVRRLLRGSAVEVVIAYAVDRLSRNQNHIGVLFDEVEQAGARLDFVTERFEDTAIGRFILAARAFIAEVEREKIAERTTRGKIERARSGRLPQATGKGIYGYRYNSQTGQREIVEEQASVVRVIFERFCNSASCNRIAVELNREGVPAFGGGRWHPLTIRRILENETYTGRTLYRRTRVDRRRGPLSGKKQRRVSIRDKSEWIEIVGATPPLIGSETFSRVQAILEDPARRLRGQPSRHYRLRGHIRCLACDTPMVGQALMRGRYRYYRCRRSYAGYGEERCGSRYVPVSVLEAAVLEQLGQLLADPERVLAEARRLNQENCDSSRLLAVREELSAIEAQQRRLARLYTSGTLPDNILAEESTRLSSQREILERERRDLEASRAPGINIDELMQALPEVLARLHTLVLNATEEDMTLLLRALQVQVRASHDQVVIEGVVPALRSAGEEEGLVTIERTSA